MGGHCAAVVKLVEWGATLDMLDEDGFPPIDYAITDKRDDIVNALIDAGADVNKRAKNLKTPLHCASLEGTPACVSALLRAGLTWPPRMIRACVLYIAQR